MIKVCGWGRNLKFSWLSVVSRSEGMIQFLDWCERSTVKIDKTEGISLNSDILEVIMLENDGVNGWIQPWTKKWLDSLNIDGRTIPFPGNRFADCGPGCIRRSTLHDSSLKQIMTTWGEQVEANRRRPSTLPKQSNLQETFKSKANSLVIICCCCCLNISLFPPSAWIRWITNLSRITSKRSDIIGYPAEGQALVQQSCVAPDVVVVRKRQETISSQSVIDVQGRSKEWVCSDHMTYVALTQPAQLKTARSTDLEHQSNGQPPHPDTWIGLFQPGETLSYLCCRQLEHFLVVAIYLIRWLQVKAVGICVCEKVVEHVMKRVVSLPLETSYHLIPASLYYHYQSNRADICCCHRGSDTPPYVSPVIHRHHDNILSFTQEATVINVQTGRSKSEPASVDPDEDRSQWRGRMLGFVYTWWPDIEVETVLTWKSGGVPHLCTGEPC